MWQLHTGDMLYVYTDGVTEATRSDDVLYGNDRLVNALNSTSSTDPSTVIETVKEDIDRFMGDAPQFDDITMMAVSWHGGLS